MTHLIAIDEGYEAIVSSGARPALVDVTHDHVSTIMYTSGTTGHPKGAMITHGMTFWNCVNLGIPVRITPDAVQLVVLPLFHTGGLNCYANPVLHAGGRIVIARTFDPGEALRVIGDPAYGITHFFAVPAPFQFMMQHPDFETTDLSRLQVAGVGGAPCALTILETWASRGVEVAQGYGMTETSPSSVFIDPADAIRKIGSAGKPVLHTEVRIVREDGTDAGPGEVGELWTRGPNVTPGYWNKPEATAASFQDGWLKTGDAARTDDEGYIYIVDRWKDMYISGGENVYPAEVENVLYQLPEVAEAAVIGVPSEKWGESGMAVLVLKPGTTLDRQRVIAHCVERLAKFKVPAHVRGHRGAAPQRHRQGAQAGAAHAVRRDGRAGDHLRRLRSRRTRRARGPSPPGGAPPGGPGPRPDRGARRPPPGPSPTHAGTGPRPRRRRHAGPSRRSISASSSSVRSFAAAASSRPFSSAPSSSATSHARLASVLVTLHFRLTALMKASWARSLRASVVHADMTVSALTIAGTANQARRRAAPRLPGASSGPYRAVVYPGRLSLTRPSWPFVSAV